MRNITQKLVLTSIIFGGIGSTNIEAAYLRGLWSRAASAVRNIRSGSYKKLGFGAASTGSIVYNFWPFSKPKQQNPEGHRDHWKWFSIEMLDGERSYLKEYIRNERKREETSWNIYYGFPGLSERFGPTHPHLQIKRNLARNKETGHDVLPAVKINMEKCKLCRDIGNESSSVRLECREQNSDRLFDYLFSPVGRVYDDQHKEVALETPRISQAMLQFIKKLEASCTSTDPRCIKLTEKQRDKMRSLRQKFAINEALLWEAVEADNAMSLHERFDLFLEKLEAHCTEFENAPRK